MRGATDYRLGFGFVDGISIHAPHAGRDADAETSVENLGISIHAPHAGRDYTVGQIRRYTDGFQSTRPMRGATSGRIVSWGDFRNEARLSGSGSKVQALL